MKKKKIEILGVKIDNLNREAALRQIEDFLEDKRQHYLVTPNPEFLVEAQKDENFRQILNQADLAVPDGVGLIWASRFLRQPLIQRITGVDLMEDICRKANEKGWLVFLAGGRAGVAQEAAHQLKKRYPYLKIKTVEEPTDLPTDLGSEKVVLFLALGAPRQEKWIKRHLESRPQVKLAMGVGGAFDFISGRIRRAPRLIQKAGLEWLWRFFLQPWRAKRIFRAVVIFPHLVIKEHLKRNFH